jgi:hypothetical protein
MPIIRGLFTFNDTLYAVSDGDLVRVDSTGARTTVGTLSSTGGNVDIEQNLTQLCITDATGLYVFDGTTLTTATGYVPGDRIGFVDQRIVGTQLYSQRFGWSPLGDALTWAALDFASAEGSPDNLISLVCTSKQILLLGSTSGELWNSVGGTEVFSRNGSDFLEVGCCSAHSAQKVAGTVMWLARDQRGQATVRILNGYSAARVSTRAIEERFEGRDLSNAKAFCWSDGGHEFYALNVPGVDTTLVYDATYRQWHERAELVDGNYTQWRATCHAFAYGRHFFGAADGTIYRMDPELHTYGGDVLCRERVAPVISQPGRKLLRFPHFELVCDKATSGTVMLRHSSDNGATFGNWRYKTAGANGRHRERIRFDMLGSAYDRVYAVRMTDDAPWNPVAVEVGVL